MRAAALDEVVAHAREEAPRECCGLLLGVANRVESAFRARNALDSFTSYLVEPEDHFAAIRAARSRRLAVIGAYHSHPAAPADASPRDIAEAAYPDFIYLIVALGSAGPPDVRAYQPEGGNFRVLELVRLT